LSPISRRRPDTDRLNLHEVCGNLGQRVLLEMEGAGVEFHRGNQRRRLIDALKLRRQQALTEALDAVIHTVRDFGGDDQADDLTLILVRGVM